MRFIALSNLLLLSPSYNGIIVYLNFHFRSWDNILYIIVHSYICENREQKFLQLY